MSVMFGSAASLLMQVAMECDRAGPLTSLDAAGWAGGVWRRGYEGILLTRLNAVRKPCKDNVISIKHFSN